MGSDDDQSYFVLVRSADGGRSWALASPPCSWYKGPGPIRATAPLQAWTICPHVMGADLQPIVLWSTSDGGGSWQRVEQPDRDRDLDDYDTRGELMSLSIDLWFLDAAHGWHSALVTGDAVLRTTDDGGHTWARVATLPNITLTTVRFVSPTQGYAIARPVSQGATGTDAVLETRDGGRTWQARYPTP